MSISGRNKEERIHIMDGVLTTLPCVLNLIGHYSSYVVGYCCLGVHLSHLILCLRGFPSFDKTKKKESEGLSETVGARIDGRERQTEREREEEEEER